MRGSAETPFEFMRERDQPIDPLYSAIRDRKATRDRDWINDAIRVIEADYNRSADTHLVPVPLPATPGVKLYLKDESAHPTGSLKHRLARSLFLYGLCNGRLGPQTTIVEASSGSTAVSEAYFARMLNVPFVAVMPATTSTEKIAQITRYGGRCHFAETPGAIYTEAEQLATKLGGHYMDQFTFAERATDWRGNNNIAESIFGQMAQEIDPIPTWIVVGAGTGGTSATIGRFIRYRRLKTRLCLADPEGSVFHRHLADPTVRTVTGCPSLIEGIGRPRCEPSFLPELIDRSYAVPDAASFASARVISSLIGRSCGGSTGTNIWAAAQIIADMHRRGEAGSIVTLICDSGERYRSTHLDDEWLASKGIDLQLYIDTITAFFNTGALRSLPRSQG